MQAAGLAARVVVCWKHCSEGLTLRKTSTSSYCLSRKKQLAMAWRPGMVSHSLGLEPTTCSASSNNNADNTDNRGHPWLYTVYANLT